MGFTATWITGPAHIFRRIKLTNKKHHGTLNSWFKPPGPTEPIHPFTLKWAHGVWARVHASWLWLYVCKNHARRVTFVHSIPITMFESEKILLEDHFETKKTKFRNGILIENVISKLWPLFNYKMVLKNFYSFFVLKHICVGQKEWQWLCTDGILHANNALSKKAFRKLPEPRITFLLEAFFSRYCIVPRWSVTFWPHAEIIPVGQFFRQWIKSINQSIDQEWQQIPTTMVEALRSRSFRLIDWLIDDKLTLIRLVYWSRTIRSVLTGAGLKWPNTAGQYSTFHQYWYTAAFWLVH